MAWRWARKATYAFAKGLCHDVAHARNVVLAFHVPVALASPVPSYLWVEEWCLQILSQSGVPSVVPCAPNERAKRDAQCEHSRPRG